MRRKLEIPFAFNAASFKEALSSLNASIASRNGKLIEVKVGQAEGHEVGLIVVEEDV